MRSPHKSVAALAVVAMLNAGLFFTLGCATLCAFSPCPLEARQAPIEHCHQKAPLPAQHSVPAESNDSHHGTGCAHHRYPMASIILPATPNVAPGIYSGTHSIGLAWVEITSTLQVAPLCDTLSHSPPGFSTGRTLCRNNSLLRI